MFDYIALLGIGFGLGFALASWLSKPTFKDDGILRGKDAERFEKMMRENEEKWRK